MCISNKIILKKSGKKIVTVTYQSFKKFVAIIKKDTILINYLVYDEAHHTVGDRIQDIVYNDDEFDNKLNRIGYGKGYYDRYLKKIRKIKKKSIFLGIAYSFQKYKKVPVNKYDFKLDYILTEQGIISSNK